MNTEQKPKWRLLKGTLAVIGVLSVAALVNSTFNAEAEPTSEPRIVQAVSAPAPALNWYEGGTLHKKTLGDWKTAMDRDQLATAADFVAKLRNFSTMESMKSAATEMKACITKTATLDAASSQRVTEIAAACALLLGYKN